MLPSPLWLGWPLWNTCVTNDHGYVPLVLKTSLFFSHSRFITGFVTRLTRRVPLVEHELLTPPEHLSSPPLFSGVSVTRSLVLYVCFVDPCLSFCTFSLGHCVVCSSSIYGFWLLRWYLQTLLVITFPHKYMKWSRYCVYNLSSTTRVHRKLYLYVFIFCIWMQ